MSENREETFTVVINHLVQTQMSGSKILYCFFPVQDESNFIGEAAAQIISQEKDLILFGYDYLDEDAGHGCEMQLEDMATSIRDRLPLKDRDHSVFPFRRR